MTTRSSSASAERGKTGRSTMDVTSPASGLRMSVSCLFATEPMTISRTRRTLITAAVGVPAALSLLSLLSPLAAATTVVKRKPVRSFAELEKDFQGRVGVAAIDLGSGRSVGNRQDERFPFCSTFKTLVGAAVLAREAKAPGLLQKRLTYTKADLVTYSPVTERHVEGGMTVAELCAATIQTSDNTAANVLMKELGGPAAITAYARSIGDTSFRLDRWETDLNTAIPGDERDTTTPLAMARTLQKLFAGDALPPAQRQQLKDWMLGTTTGDTRIRAGVPPGWQVADKTGTGSYGVTNDIGVAYPPGGAPVVVVVYTHGAVKDADSRSDIVAAATRTALAALAA